LGFSLKDFVMFYYKGQAPAAGANLFRIALENDPGYGEEILEKQDRKSDSVFVVCFEGITM
jgi:hypothetical protein